MFSLIVSTHKTLVPAVDRRPCGDQWWCVGRGYQHSEQAACDAGNVWMDTSLGCRPTAFTQSDIRHCHQQLHRHHGGMSKKPPPPTTLQNPSTVTKPHMMPLTFCYFSFTINSSVSNDVILLGHYG